MHAFGPKQWIPQNAFSYFKYLYKSMLSFKTRHRRDKRGPKRYPRVMKNATEKPGLQEYKETMVHIHTCEKNVGTEFSKLQNPMYKTSYIIFPS